MPREDDPPMDDARGFDAIIDTIRARDGTPGPNTAFVGSLEKRLLGLAFQRRRDRMHADATMLGPYPTWTPRWARTGVRWPALAVTIALLLATVGGGYLGGIGLPRDERPENNIAAPMTGSPDPEESVTPAGSPVAVERRIGSCDARKTYMSSPGGYVLLENPRLFGDTRFPLEQMQLQHWSFGIGLGREYPANEWDGVDGLVMDTVTSGIYRATFDGPVVVSTWYGGLGGWISTEMAGVSNTVDLGVGESVLFEAGTPHEVENTSELRGMSVERLILFSGDATTLLPTVERVKRPSEPIISNDSQEDEGVTVRLDGTGTIPPDAAPAGWDNAIITTEFVVTLDDPLTTLIPPCEDPDYEQVRNVDEMFNAVPPPTGEPPTNQYIGYLVWIGEGGRG